VPEFGGETSSATEAKEPAPPTQKIEEPATVPKAPSAKLAEPKVVNIEETRVEGTKILEVLSPSAEVTVPKGQKGLTATPKRKRMASVLDVLETIKTSSSTPGKIAEASKTHTDTRLTEAEATKSQANTEAGPSEPVKEKSLETREKAAEKEVVEQILLEKVATPTPKAPSEALDYIIRHASGKRLSEKEIFEAKHYARELKYPKGALVFNDTDEDDFLYCLPDNKELSVCREMSRSMGFSKLEAGLCAMTKDDLADSLAYNSLKVQKLYIWKFTNSELFFCSYINSFILFISGLILSNALRAQKNAEDESCTIALNNLRTEVIKMRNEALEKDKILLTLVDKVKGDEANYKTQSEIQRSEIENLQKQLAEAKLKCAIAEADRDASDYWKNYWEKQL
jgi:hypothetical protein